MNRERRFVKTIKRHELQKEDLRYKEKGIRYWPFVEICGPTWWQLVLTVHGNYSKEETPRFFVSSRFTALLELACKYANEGELKLYMFRRQFGLNCHGYALSEVAEVIKHDNEDEYSFRFEDGSSCHEEPNTHYSSVLAPGDVVFPVPFD